MSEPNGDSSAAVLHHLKTWSHHGPKSKYALADSLGLDAREVEAAVEHLRQVDAEPITSSASGYQWTDDPDAVRECRERQFDARLRTMFLTRRGLIRAERKLRRGKAAQMPLFQETLQ